MTFFQSGQSERVKLAVHAASGALAVACCGYNLIAFCFRRERHLAINTALYASIVAIEANKVVHHYRAGAPR